MFDLDSAIAAWREQLVRGGIGSPEVLDELESHLREEIDRQVQAEFTPQQAFEAAVQRFGETNAVTKELKRAGAIPPTRQQALFPETNKKPTTRPTARADEKNLGDWP